jgi:diguanylate cyclase (GGDEF)-like protein
MSNPFIPADSAHARDRLTGALNRQYFLELLAEEKQCADRNGRAFVLCLIDVDQLRNINDQVGQDRGDDVLLCVANKLRDVLDAKPWSNLNYLHARYDGDGLMLLLRSPDLEHGRRFAETLRARFGASGVARQYGVTVSVGVTRYDLGESVDVVLGRTERTLFLAKQSGRDCVEVALPAATEGQRDNVVYLRETPWRDVV